MDKFDAVEKFAMRPSFALVLVWALLFNPEFCLASSPPPTATEVFNLRSKCAALGDKILKENEANNLNPMPPRANQQAVTGYEELSHYDAVSNRCYVKLESTTNNYQDDKKSHMDTILLDGQTGERLAYTSIPSRNHMDFVERKKESFGAVYDKQYQGPSYDFDAAGAYIEKMMNEDRKE